MHGDFDYELFSVYENSTGWENLFIKIYDKKRNSKKFVVGNIYRVPNELSDHLQIINKEFAET